MSHPVNNLMAGCRLISLVFILSVPFTDYAQPALKDDPAVFLSKLIQIKSITGDERRAGRFMLDYCSEKGLKTSIFSDSDSSFNFCASLYPLSEKKPNIIFLSHLDVVPAVDTGSWTYPPFSGIIKDGFIWGRGAIDCKGLMVMQLFSVLNFLEESKMNDLPYNVSVLFVSGEEGWYNDGSEYVSGHYMDELNPAVIFGEGGSGLQGFMPSEPELAVFGISVAEKKALWLKLTAHVPASGHSAAPPELYANKRLLKVLIKLLDEKKIIRFDKQSRQMFNKLGKIQGGFKGFVISHANWDIFRPLVKSYFKEGGVLYPFVYNTFVITNISGLSSGTNQISDEASAILDCRLFPETQTEKFIKKIENIAGPKVTVDVILETPGAKPSDPGTGYYKTMAESLQHIYPESHTVPILFPGTTDNNFYRRKDVPVYGILPCIFTEELLGTIHGSNERIPVSDLYKGIQTITECIRRLTSTEN
jgi:carboxypeptidase PM20D1